MKQVNPISYAKAALEPIYGVVEANSMAQILLEDAFNFRARRDTTFSDWSTLDAFLSRLKNHEPLQYILGEADFLGLKITVSPAVLIPRAETEELADWVAKTIKKVKPEAKVLDIGTGSGCIPVYLKRKCPFARIQACDVSATALAIAESNAERYHLPIDFFEINILEKTDWGIFQGKFDIIVSNPPYIPPSERLHMPKHVLAHEPDLALFSPEENPLIFYDTIADFAKEKLNPGGQLFFECNSFNAKEVVRIVQEKGFSEVELKEDMMGMDRMVRAYF